MTYGSHAPDAGQEAQDPNPSQSYAENGATSSNRVDSVIELKEKISKISTPR
ncbi:Coronatine-insensitive protein-like protein 1b [Senna tora]|uniref:Coronatine-insensitive protein-like protein 1b n=1 Tax=Senna tora TaxID=362788 RepID=A0A834WJQ6_9FABA|nr:Coronatine-insensitive protein-like protein 1b [Senna tora]